MKNNLMLLTMIISLMIPGCGSNKKEPQAELQAIDQEIVMLRSAAYRHQSEMSQAEFAAIIESFSTSSGIKSGEVDATGDRVSSMPGTQNFEGPAS